MLPENIIFSSICWFCSLIFWTIALWALKRKDPMHFWSGSTVKSEEITNIPLYNRANGIMWSVYGVWIAVAGVLALLNIVIGAILLVVICIPGIFVLVAAYNRIYNKYRSTSAVKSIDGLPSKTPKGIIVVLSLIIVITFTAVAALFIYGEKDPLVDIFDDYIQIKTMFGLNIDFFEITDIYLIEKSMSELGIGMRTNGYGGFGNTLKGNFKSAFLGDTLLFVQSKSSPTIRIERKNKKDVYISLRSNENTERLYNNLIAALEYFHK